MNTHDSRIGLIGGVIGGVSKYLLQINSVPFVINLIGAAITALICGACGVGGKEAYLFIKKKLKKD